MSDMVRPAALFSGAPVPTIGLSGILGTVPNPPPQVSQLSVGSTLTGVVVGHDAKGHTLVRTDLGTLAVATKAQLPVNSEVTLQIRSSVGGHLQVLIVHSEPPQSGPKGAPAPQAHQAPNAQVGGTQTGGAQASGAGPQGQAATAVGANQAVPAGHGPATDLLTLGQHLRAVVQSPAAAPHAAATSGQAPTAPALTALAAQLVPGSELQLRIVSVQSPGSQSGATQPGGVQAAGNPAPGGPVPGVAAPGVAAPGFIAPGAPAPGLPGPVSSGAIPGGAPGPTGGTAAHGALPGGSVAGQAVSPTAPGAMAHPDAAAPQGAAPANPAGQGAPPGAAPGVAPGGAVGAAPGTPAAAIVAPASGVPASGAIASYAAAAGGSSGAPAVGPGPGAAAGQGALAAAQGIGQGSGSGAQVQASQPGTAPGTNTPSTLPGGNTGGATVAATPTIPGAAPSPGAAAGAGAMQFTGTVTAVTHAGQPILQTPLGTLTLEIRAPLQAGSQIAFDVLRGALAPSGPGAAGAGPAALGTLAHSWPALEETLRVLQEVAPPGVASATLQHAIPQPGSRLASGLLFFLSALSGGNVARWIGNQAVQALKNAGRESLLSRLGQDFGQLGRLADNEGGDWRLFFIPLHDGDQLQQLRLFLRHGRGDRDGGPGQDDEDHTRFVVEVEMSRLGDLQLDGLVREKRLDLILRSRAPLPDFMRRDITQIFHEANEITGNRGSIGFQPSNKWKAMPIEAPQAAADTGVLV